MADLIAFKQRKVEQMGSIRVYIRGISGDNGKEMETTIMGYIGIIGYMGGCQNSGPFLAPYDHTPPNIKGTQKGTMILRTTKN